ncbi:MAG: ABC transporter substrate-binding protein [Aggregatilineales bacterium]
MLKGYRAPLAALIVALALLGVVVLTPSAPLPVLTPAVTVLTATSIPVSPVAITPAPTIPIQQIDPTTLKEALVGSPKKLNPLLAGYNQIDRDLSALIFEGMFTTDAYGASVPDLASAMPDISADGLTYVVSLRTDVLWQDGMPFSADDVLFTIHLMQADDFPGPTALRTFWQSIEVDELDAHTVRFRLAQPLASFPDSLRIGLLPRHALAGITAGQLLTHPFNVSPIGTGPYQFDGWLGANGQISGIKLQFAATYRQRPEGKTGFTLQHLIFRFYPSFDAAVDAFQRGEVFSISELPLDMLNKVAALTQLRRYFQYRPAFGAIIYNWQGANTPFFRNLQFRQALTRAVNRDALVAQYLPGRALPASSPILPDSWAYASNVDCAQINPYDTAGAQSLMAVAVSQQIAPPTAGPAALGTAAATSAATSAAPSDSSISDPPGTATADSSSSDPSAKLNFAAPPAAASIAPASGSAFHFQLLVTNDPALVGMAQDIIKAWNAIGVSVQIVVTDTPTFNARLIKRDFDAALVELNLAPSADPDPYTLWRQPPADGGLNFGGMNDRRLNDLVEAARREPNGVQRAALYHDYQKTFCSEAAALLLYDPVYVYGADTRIAGIQLGFIAEPSDRFRTIQAWHF